MHGGTYEKSFQKMNYFCIAKTYPVPSNKYIESTCTAGILEEPDGRRRLVRVYPMPFRYLEGEQQFPKYNDHPLHKGGLAKRTHKPLLLCHLTHTPDIA